MNVLFIYPPPESFYIKNNQRFYGLSPPLGLLYLAKILEDNGDTVTILDFSTEPFNKNKLSASIDLVDIVGFTVLSSSLTNVKNIIHLIKQQRSDIPILIGGPHCSLLPEKALEETQADICVQGDGEIVLRNIINILQSNKNFSDIPGVFYRRSTEIIHGPPSQPICDLDSIPFPSRHLVKHYVYGREFNPSLRPGEFTAIITSRGCPYRCRFCSRASINMQRYRMRSNENILAELRNIQQQGFHHVAFADDCFPANTKQAHSLFDAIINENLNMKYSVTASRVDLADEELFKKMKQAGVTHIQFGLESGNQDVLDFYNKQTTIETIKKTIHLSHDTGFFTIGSFIFGAPFETTQHFQRTVSFAKSLPLDSVSFLPLRYMVGSDLWNQAVNEGKISKTEYLVYADKNKGLGLYEKEQLFLYCRNAQRSFYSRPMFFINLLKTSLRKNDMTYVQSYLSIFFSYVRGFF